MQVSPSLYISSPGLDAQQQSLLQTAINRLSKHDRHFFLDCKYSRKAHLLILDCDSNSAMEVLKNSRDGQVKLLLSDQPKSGRNIIPIRKPLELPKLIKLLEKICVKMLEHLHRISSATKMQQSTQIRSISQEKSGLFELLYTVKADKSLCSLKHPELSTVYLDGENKLVASKCSAHELKGFTQLDPAKIQVEKMDRNHMRMDFSEYHITPLYNLLWSAGIQDSQVKLIDGCSLNVPIKLKAWPNFTRNEFLPIHLKIAAQLARDAMTLKELLQNNHLAENDVIRFFNSAYAVDLIDYGYESVPAESGVRRKISDQMKSIFGEIAKRLSLA